MARELLRDLAALVRMIGSVGRIPAVRRRAVEYVAVYDDVVAPLVCAAVRDPGRSARTNSALRAAGVKLAFLVAGYAAMTDAPFRTDLAVLGGAAVRAYDDLLDEFGCTELDRRLTVLFDGGPFTPTMAMEQLFHDIYREVEQRLGRHRSDPIFAAMVSLHECQIRSRRQHDPTIPAPVLAEITRGKGGHGTVVLFGLVHPAMSEPETALAYELGSVLQRLDDFQDVELDRQAGVTTEATRGELTLAGICRRLRALRPALRRQYGRVRPLYAVVYVYLWFSFLRRHWPRLGTGAGVVASPLGVLLRPGDNLVQRADHRRGTGLE